MVEGRFEYISFDDFMRFLPELLLFRCWHARDASLAITVWMCPREPRSKKNRIRKKWRKKCLAVFNEFYLEHRKGDNQ